MILTGRIWGQIQPKVGFVAVTW